MLTTYATENDKCRTREAAARDAANDQKFAEIRQQQRFNWLADQLSGRISYHTVEGLKDKLASEPIWPGQWEKAAVLLALKATPEAIAALECIDTSLASNSFRSLYDKCLAEGRLRLAKAA